MPLLALLLLATWLPAVEIESDEDLASADPAGVVKIDCNGRSAITDAGMVHLRRFTALRELELNSRIRDGGLLQLAGLPLTVLDISNSQVGVEGMAVLGQLPRLERLVLINSASATDAFLAPLSGRDGLRSLVLNAALGDGALVHLAHLTTLESLALSDAPISAAGLRQLAGCRGLRRLICGSNRLDDAGLAVLAQWPQLRELALPEGVTDACIPQVLACRELTHLYWRLGRFSEEGVARLRAGLPRLRHEWAQDAWP